MLLNLLLMGLILLLYLVTPTQDAKEAADRGADRGTFAGIATDGATNSACGRTAGCTAERAEPFLLLRRIVDLSRLAGIHARLLLCPLVAGGFILLLLFGALAPVGIDEHLRLRR